MSKSIINSEVFFEHLRLQLNEQMMKAAEPLIAEALAKIELEVRTKLAACLIGLVEQRTMFYEQEDHLVIHINRENSNGR